MISHSVKKLHMITNSRLKMTRFHVCVVLLNVVVHLIKTSTQLLHEKRATFPTKGSCSTSRRSGKHELLNISLRVVLVVSTGKRRVLKMTGEFRVDISRFTRVQPT